MAEASCRLSVVVITLNEVDRLKRLIQSVGMADEIIVVDSGSTDGTFELSQRLGARVIRHEFMGYVAQKNWAMEQAKCEWVLSLDGDEALSPELAEEIAATLASKDPEVVGYSMPRLSYYLGRWISHGGWYPDRKVRLVRRGRAKWRGEDPHDFLSCDGPERKLNNAILHFVYRNIGDQIVTINKFSTIFAAQRGRRKNWYVVVGMVHSIFKFIECYLWNMGVLDGIPGLIIAMNSAFYVFLKHAKAWEAGLKKDSL